MERRLDSVDHGRPHRESEQDLRAGERELHVERTPRVGDAAEDDERERVANYEKEQLAMRDVRRLAFHLITLCADFDPDTGFAPPTPATGAAVTRRDIG